MKRGPKNFKGYSIKQIGDYSYCYVWDEYDKESTDLKRGKDQHSKSYSKMKGWRSLGRWDKQETRESLKEFLKIKYNKEIKDED